MKKSFIFLLALLPVLAIGQDKSWVEESNKNAQVLLDVLARFNPEAAAQLGVDGFDNQVIDLQPKIYERNRDALLAAQRELESRLPAASNPAVRQDLQILIKSARDNIESARLQDELLLPYIATAPIVFQGIQALLDPRIPKERQAAAAVRLRRYAGLEPGSTALTQLAKDRASERFGDSKLAGPYKGQVEQDLADSARLIDGTKTLFTEFGIKGQEAALAAIEQQLKDYDEWVRKEILPRARADHRLPPAIYADNLKQFGVDVDPEELMRRALVSFAEIRNEMQVVAATVAKQKGYKSSDYRDVIRQLKKQQVSGKAILPLYDRTLASIEEIVRQQRIVTLPSRKAVIRLGSEAESAVQPAPHMRAPRLIGNTGEYGEFVLPLKVPNAGGKDLQMDDFTNAAASWTLTAHEARPGHELQFAAMIERGVSTARAVFAFNSVNVEGWALYAEAEMKRYFPPEGQLMGLQHRMMRAARAFLDPMVNLGRLTPEQVDEFLQREVVLSEGMAKQEKDRYTYRAPGQATSYFVGYQALMATRERAELALGTRFNRQRFHDFVLAQGLLPPELLQKAVTEEFLPAERARDK
ncbi:MAG TPA: DUF885 domain-containing protein [Solimonas sp.]|nr:DUF885 domain-containing protein [Solimonas sp.]